MTSAQSIRAKEVLVSRLATLEQLLGRLIRSEHPLRVTWRGRVSPFHWRGSPLARHIATFRLWDFPHNQ
jgi:hypothetical protein